MSEQDEGQAEAPGEHTAPAEAADELATVEAIARSMREAAADWQRVLTAPGEAAQGKPRAVEMLRVGQALMVQNLKRKIAVTIHGDLLGPGRSTYTIHKTLPDKRTAYLRPEGRQARAVLAEALAPWREERRAEAVDAICASFADVPAEQED